MATPIDSIDSSDPASIDRGTPASPGSPGAREDRPTSFGVYKPVGHLVISFPSAEHADAARQALGDLPIAPEDIHAYTDREMVAQVADDLRQASPLAAIGQEINLLRSHGELAERGYHFLAVKAENDEQARQIADLAQRHEAERAQYYGHFIIEEMIEREVGRPQVAESPDRGLDTHPKPPLPR
ncbi:hypothetical protein [Roseateles amylovorans]|uniref:Uncharacterized protein n=1 Tax=Roseateles amylovorans TaxID=2978473 RepID=A0ABY6B579_9BURK|nr:hypothetical protein [Roseateles amylovorans]UXH80533.1 hypothetical protein N4261_11945 [Roseateles amylovorans]